MNGWFKVHRIQWKMSYVKYQNNPKTSLDRKKEMHKKNVIINNGWYNEERSEIVSLLLTYRRY